MKSMSQQRIERKLAKRNRKLNKLSKSSVVSEPTEDEIFNKLPKFWFIGGSKKSTSMPYEIAKATAKTIYELYHPKAR